MKKGVVLLIFLGFVSVVFAQENNLEAKNDTVRNPSSLTGRIINVKDKTPLPSAHILNLNSVEGTVTNNKGQFQIPVQANDTIFISYIGFQSVKLKITNDLLKGNQLEIEIHEKVLNMDEVTVKAHDLIGVLVVDAKNVPMDRFSRIHINGLPQAYEIGRAKPRSSYNSTLNAIFNPADFWYNKLGKKPKELNRLKKLKEGDQVREMMEQKFNREVLMNYLDMSRKELNDLLTECNYSDSFISRASDLQVLEAFLECFENHRAIQKGKVKHETIRLRDSSYVPSYN